MRLDNFLKEFEEVKDGFVMDLEELREEYLKTKNEECLNEIIRLLPNSYKVVKL